MEPTLSTLIQRHKIKLIRTKKNSHPIAIQYTDYLPPWRIKTTGKAEASIWNPKECALIDIPDYTYDVVVYNTISNRISCTDKHSKTFLDLPSVFPNSMKCSLRRSLLNFSRSAFWTFLAAIGFFNSTSGLCLWLEEEKKLSTQKALIKQTKTKLMMYTAFQLQNHDHIMLNSYETIT